MSSRRFSFGRVLIVVAVAIILGCAISPLVGVWVDVEFQRVVSRSVMICAVAGIWGFRRALGIPRAEVLGLRWDRRARGEFVGGLLLAVFGLVVLSAVRTAMGASEFHPHGTVQKIVPRIIRYGLTALLVGVGEEWLFRGILLQSLMKRWATVTAVIMSSLIYATIHFIKAPDVPPLEVFEWSKGFRVFGSAFQPFATPGAIVPFWIGLVLVGGLLATAYLKTQGLALSIGLHAGFFFFLKMDGWVVEDLHRSPQWVFSDHWLITGIPGWIGVLVLWWAVSRLERRRTAG